MSFPQNTPVMTKKLAWWVPALAFALLGGFLVMLWLSLQRVQQGTIVLGEPAPSFEMTTFDGELIRTRDLAGKVIVVNFWASWCNPCAEEARFLEEAWQAYQPGGEVIFIGVDYTDVEPRALAYLEKYQVTYPNGPDLRTSISQMFRTHGVPETYIIDRQGRLAYLLIGPFGSLAEIKAAVDHVLAQE